MTRFRILIVSLLVLAASGGLFLNPAAGEHGGGHDGDCGGGPGVVEYDFEIPTHADTYLFNTSRYSNYGDSSNLFLKMTNTWILVKFDVVGMSGPPSKVVLQLQAVGSSVGNFDVYATDSDWEEMDVTVDNSTQERGELIGSFETTETDETGNLEINIEVTDYVTGNGTYSFYLFNGTSTTVDSGGQFTSREGAAEQGVSGPTLAVAYDPES